MRVFILCGVVGTIATVVHATPTPPDFAISAPSTRHPLQFMLRANCPQRPWHGRHLVTLPSSQQLGLENFTTHPSTPPLRFRPIKVADGNYALRGEGGTDDFSRAPFLAALKSTTGTRTASMAIVYTIKPDRDAFAGNNGACPTGYECSVDQWAFDDAMSDRIHPKFRFAGFKGNWEPFKDAGKEGWHVYWKANAGIYHPIQLDLVPADD